MVRPCRAVTWLEAIEGARTHQGQSDVERGLWELGLLKDNRVMVGLMKEPVGCEEVHDIGFTVEREPRPSRIDGCRQRQRPTSCKAGIGMGQAGAKCPGGVC